MKKDKMSYKIINSTDKDYKTLFSLEDDGTMIINGELALLTEEQKKTMEQVYRILGDKNDLQMP